LEISFDPYITQFTDTLKAYLFVGVAFRDFRLVYSSFDCCMAQDIYLLDGFYTTFVIIFYSFSPSLTHADVFRSVQHASVINQ